MTERAQSVRGGLLFAILFLLLSVFLVSQLGEEARFSSKGKLFAQPAFWPGVGVIGMAFFGCLHLLVTLLSTRRLKSPEDEEKKIVQPREIPESPSLGVQAESSRSASDTSVVDIVKNEFKEGISWLRAFEYFAWFMLYVYLAPVIGYLAATIVFLVTLTLRAGYRDRRMTIAAVVVGIAIVLVFKSFLGVKIPGGAVYEALPDALRSFMIIYF